MGFVDKGIMFLKVFFNQKFEKPEIKEPYILLSFLVACTPHTFLRPMERLKSLNEMIYLFFTDKGELFGWGNSEYGQIPMKAGSQQVNMSYSLREFTRGLGKITDIAAGGSFCLIVNGESFVQKPFNQHYL